MGSMLARGYGFFGCALLGAAAWTAAILVRLDDPQVRAAVLNAGGVNILAGLAMALSGLVLVAHDGFRSIGRLLLLGGTGCVLAEAIGAVASAAGVGNQAVLTALTVIVAASVTAYYLALYAAPLFLPAGRLPGRAAAVVVAVLAVASTVEGVRDTVLAGDWYDLPDPVTYRPFTVLGPLDPWRFPLMSWAPAALAGVSLTVMAVRWRGAGAKDALLAPLLVPYLLWIAMWLFGSWLYPLGLPWWGTDGIWYAVAATWLVMVGYAAARDRSRHLDRSARRVLSHCLLTTAVLVGLLALTAVLYLALTPSPAMRSLAVGAVALVFGSLLQPAARWSTRVVDRYYYGERAKPYQSVRALAEQLSRAGDPADAPRVLCATAVEVLGLPGACLEAHGRDGSSRVLAAAGIDTSGLDGGSQSCFPLSHRGTVIGQLIVAPRPGERVLDRQDTEAVEILTAHAAPAVAAVRLYEDLQRSHQELLLAREEERRRLRHELHDGLGPALSGLRLQIDVARGSCPEQLAERLEAASADLGQAVDELRRITHGLVPGALDRHDLAAALRELAERLTGPALCIDLDLSPQPLPPLAAELETALYRIAAEALNNAARHARADQVRLRVSVTTEGVSLAITDNGRGLAPGARAGIGLLSMTRRTSDLGGTISITSTPGNGTAVTARFPPTPPHRPA